MYIDSLIGTIKESIYIRVNSPTLNRNIGKFNLHHIWDRVLLLPIKESIYIRVNSPTLNRNISKFNLHHIWNKVPLNTPGLKIKRHVQDIGHAQSTQPNTPKHFFTGFMEHAQRTPLSEHVHRTS